MNLDPLSCRCDLRKRRQAGSTPNANANLFALACFVAKRLECVRLAGAFAIPQGWARPNALISSTHDHKFSIFNSQFLVFNLPLIPLFVLFLLSGAFTGCSPKRSETPEQRSEAARTLFEHITKTFHIPSAEAKGTEKESLQSKAADGYTQLLKLYPEQDYWAAQALRSLG